jgi:hypothetical protein
MRRFQTWSGIIDFLAKLFALIATLGTACFAVARAYEHFTAPDITALTDRLTFRCTYVTWSSENCRQGSLAVTLVLNFENADSIDRTIRSLRASLYLHSRSSQQSWNLAWVQDVAHDTRTNTAAYSEWQPLALAPEEAKAQELIFRPVMLEDGVRYSEFSCASWATAHFRRGTAAA